MSIERVGVIGAGTMGNGIAHVFARRGYAVTLCDVEQKFLDRGLETIARNLDREVARAVAVYKNAFFMEKDENGRVIDYTAAVRGSLRLAPQGAALEVLRADYSKMVDEGAMLEQHESFDELIERCRSIENEANEFDKNPTDERSRVPFEGCDAASVFSEMTSQVHSAEGRTLWARMLQEVHRKGVDASISSAF